MSHVTSNQGEKILKKRKLWKRWQKAVGALACVVVFCTTYALILPAVTLEKADRVLDCPISIHEHTSDCYDGDGNLTCGQADYVVHTHDSNCYDKDGNLVCLLPEREAHEHTEDCYKEEKKLVCGKEESAGHEHNSECYTKEQGDLICENEAEDHEHTDECYEWKDVLVCGMEEGEGAHTHTDDCYETEKFLVCGDGNASEHQHGEGCFREAEPDSEETKVPEESAGETGSETGAEHVPGAVPEEDQGTEAGTAADTDAGVPNEAENVETAKEPFTAGEKTYKDEYIEISVSYEADAKIPEEAEFLAEKLESDTETDESVPESYPYKIGFYLDGEEIEPESTVSLNVRFLSGEFADAEGVQVIHYKTDGTETIQTETELDDDGNVQAKFDMDSFSIVEFQAIGGAEPLAEVNGQNISMTVGETYTMTDHKYYDRLQGGKQSESSDPSVAALEIINSEATITAVSEGSAKITLYYHNGSRNESVAYNVTVSASGQITISFNGNGGSGTVAPITGAVDSEITFPENSFTNGNKVFVGWSTDAGANESGETHHRSTVYQPKDVYTLKRNVTFYAIWAETNKDSCFYIRIDGTIPQEPAPEGSSNDYGATAYTKGVTINNALKVAKFYANTAGVDSNLNNMPSSSQIAEMINDSSSKLGFTAEVRTVDGVSGVYVRSITNANADAVKKIGLQAGDEIYIRWYVVKSAGDGNLLSGYWNTGWHVDGTLLVKSKVNLIYDVNAPAGTWTVMPVGTQWNSGSTVKAGTNNTLNEDHGNNRNANESGVFENNIVTPSRTDGYNFAGWKKYIKDANGNYTVTDGKIYQPGDEFTITEDTQLVAQWTKGTNSLTVMKTDMAGKPLAGATFGLEMQTDDGTWVPADTELTTNANGVFTYQNMKNQTLYRMTESYAPNGYETRNSFYFKVTVDESTSKVLDMYLCREDGSVYNDTDTDKPDWVKVEYIPADTSGGTGAAQFKITIQDEQIKRNVTFKKVDDNGKPLAGATFKLTEISDTTSSSPLGIMRISDADGIFSESGATLTYGTYKLEEIDAPAGFEKAEPIIFTVNDYTIGNDKIPEEERNNGITVTSGSMDVQCEVTNSNEDNMATTTYSYTFTVTDTYAPEIRILKKSTEDSAPLKGAEFDLYSTKTVGSELVKDTKLNETVFVSDESGNLSLGGLSDGTYFLIETKAPDGYNLLSAPIQITVDKTGHRVTALGNYKIVGPDNQDGSYTITVYNSAGVTLPNTGGTGTLPYTFGGLALLAGCLVYGYSLRRKQGRRFIG